MGPPVGIDIELFAKELFRKGDVGDEFGCMVEGGRVSHERVRRHACRRMEKEEEWRGSWVDV
jgi:hypothetical protein